MVIYKVDPKKFELFWRKKYETNGRDSIRGIQGLYVFVRPDIWKEGYIIATAVYKSKVRGEFIFEFIPGDTPSTNSKNGVIVVDTMPYMKDRLPVDEIEDIGILNTIVLTENNPEATGETVEILLRNPS